MNISATHNFNTTSRASVWRPLHNQTRVLLDNVRRYMGNVEPWAIEEAVKFKVKLQTIKPLTFAVTTRWLLESCMNTLRICGIIWGRYTLKSVPRAVTMCSIRCIIVFCIGLLGVQNSCSDTKTVCEMCFNEFS